MAITYNAGTNTITVTGYSEVTPCTFLDVYNADVAGGWGVATVQCGNSQFCFNCRLVIGDGSTPTWFADTNKQIVFPDGVVTANSQFLIEGKRYAHILFGLLEDADDKITSSGVDFISLESSYSNIRFIYTSSSSGGECLLYSCSFKSPNYVHWVQTAREDDDKIYHCRFSECNPFQATGDFYSLEIQASPYGMYATGIMDRIWIGEVSYPLYARFSTGVTFSNIEVKGAYTKLFYIYNKNTNPVYAVNVDASTWNFLWSGTNTVPVYRQYTFNLQVFDDTGTAVNGAIVTLINNAGTPAFSVNTAADGTIAEQTVSRGYYDQAHGDALQDYGPFTLNITSGNLTYSHTQIVLDEPVDWRVALRAPIAVGGRRVVKKTVEKLVRSPADPALLMATGVLLVQNRSLKRRLTA